MQRGGRATFLALCNIKLQLARAASVHGAIAHISSCAGAAAAHPARQAGTGQRHGAGGAGAWRGGRRGGGGRAARGATRWAPGWASGAQPDPAHVVYALSPPGAPSGGGGLPGTSSFTLAVPLFCYALVISHLPSLPHAHFIQAAPVAAAGPRAPPPSKPSERRSGKRTPATVPPGTPCSCGQTRWRRRWRRTTG